jgi:hypothetical protein
LASEQAADANLLSQHETQHQKNPQIIDTTTMTSTSSSTPLNDKENVVPLLPPGVTGSNEGSKQTTKSVNNRIPWKAIEVATFDISDGSEKTTHPFLEETNKLDLEIAKVMLVLSPYKCKHGNKNEAWKHAASELTQQVDGGSHIFTNGITVKQLKDRFHKLMDFIKKFQGQVPFRSGEDDEEAPNELLQALEDLYEMFDSFQQEEALCSQKSAASRAVERNKAEALRQTSLGEITDESRKLVKEARESKNKTPKTPRNGQYTSTPSSGESDLIQKCNERMSERFELRKASEERKRQRLDADNKRLELEQARDNKRLELEQARYERDRSDREASMAIDRRDREALMAIFQTMATKFIEQMGKK